MKTITEKIKEIEIRTTELVTKITRWTEIITTKVNELKRTIQRLEEKFLL